MNERLASDLKDERFEHEKVKKTMNTKSQKEIDHYEDLNRINQERKEEMEEMKVIISDYSTQLFQAGIENEALVMKNKKHQSEINEQLTQSLKLHALSQVTELELKNQVDLMKKERDVMQNTNQSLVLRNTLLERKVIDAREEFVINDDTITSLKNKLNTLEHCASKNELLQSQNAVLLKRVNILAHQLSETSESITARVDIMKDECILRQDNEKEQSETVNQSATIEQGLKNEEYILENLDKAAQVLTSDINSNHLESTKDVDHDGKMVGRKSVERRSLIQLTCLEEEAERRDSMIDRIDDKIDVSVTDEACQDKTEQFLLVSNRQYPSISEIVGCLVVLFVMFLFLNRAL